MQTGKHDLYTGKKQATKTVQESNQILNLSKKDFKAIINMFAEVKELKKGSILKLLESEMKEGTLLLILLK